jgi:GMP synthase (glutamine-hydrolysing)
MARIIVLQHVPYEILGTMNPLLKQMGIRIKYVNFGRHPHAVPNVEGYHGLVILGGPMNVDQVAHYPHLETEIKVIQHAMRLQIPILGICLGAQLIAKANGAKVEKHSCTEIGWYPLEKTAAGEQDPLLCHMNSQETIFQWHGDTFAIPDNAQHLVRGHTCENQAFRIGDNVYGFQFHLEVDAAMIERWLNVAVHKAELSKLEGQIDPAIIRAEIPKYIDRSMALSKLVFTEFCKLVGKTHPPVSFTSR